jgi:L-alanine-DL-glutamate epimerase-like enolase superfamily enzyme
MMEHPVVARGEVCTFANPAPVTVRGVSAVVRERAGLPNTIAAAQNYLRLTSTAGVEGWFGPFVPNSGISAATLAEHWKLIGSGATVGSAVEALNPVWDRNPGVCAALEIALWDLQCRTIGLPLWRLLRPHDGQASPQFYASALGIASEHVTVLQTLLNAGYPVVKWTVDPLADLAAQMSSIASAGVAWRSIALDAHCRLDLARVRRLHQLAPDLAWLEDPFATDTAWDASDFPRIVTGEDLCSPQELVRLSRLPGVYAVNLEVGRLGITRACATIAALLRPCLLHGRAAPVSMHLAAAFPEAVHAIENHIVYAPERLATVCFEDAEFDPRRLWPRVIAEPGCTTAPPPAALLSAREDVLHG